MPDELTTLQAPGGTLAQGPVSALRGDDQILLRQSNGREMLLPVSVLIDHVIRTINNASIPGAHVTDLAAVAHSGQYEDLEGKPKGIPSGAP